MTVPETADETLSRQHRRALSQDPIEPGSARQPQRGVLEGRFCRLEPADPARHDMALLYPATHGNAEVEKLWDYMSFGPFADAAAMRDFFAGSAGTADPLPFVLRRKGDGALMGMASLMAIRPAFGIIEVGSIWFTPDWQGTAETTEALFLLMREAMDGLGYRRLEWKCNAFNMPSRRAALRLGFRFEGVFYNHMIIKGRNRDTAWFSLTDGEWPAVRANFERWLAPENFDAGGRQRHSLGTMNRKLWQADGR